MLGPRMMKITRFQILCIAIDNVHHLLSHMRAFQNYYDHHQKQVSEGSVPGSPAGEGAFSSLGRDRARAVARTIAQVKNINI